MLHTISDDQLDRALHVRDLTDSREGEHCMQQLVDDSVDALAASWAADVHLRRAGRVVSIADNYDALRYPPDGASRDARHTRYVSPATVLRTQMSALVPGALRELADRRPDDALVACPGVVYRRDVIDRLHVGEPHQLDLWRATRAPLTEADLERMVAIVSAALVPGLTVRTTPTWHPYTLAGREIEVATADGWVELGECGLAHPELLAASGLRGYSGLAMGIGMDRAVMLRKGIDDIRALREGDPRIAAQMRDLEPYRPPSPQPPARRDLSLAARPGLDDVELGERVRDALGVEAAWVEEVAIVSRTPCAQLAPAARARIGIRSNQENLLVRVVLRHPARSLPKREANALRDRIYAALHEGGPSMWATSSARTAARPRRRA
jgi:phenylalanyl-tRNA synthetase alpha chain